MKAVAYKQSLPISHSEALLDVELPLPVTKGRDLLVKIEAVSVNPVDTKVRCGVNPKNDKYKVLGWDAAGVVESVGEQVTLFKPSDKVWYAGAIDRAGTNAEYHLVDERIVGNMPASLSFEEAAALPLTSITAWELLFDRFHFTSQSQGTLLIIGASGGVGSIMIQLAKKLTQLTIIGTASRPETQEWIKQLGVDFVINHHKSLSQELKAIGLDKVNCVASLNNTQDHLTSIAEIIAPQGMLAVIDDPETLDITPFKRKSVSIHWEFMFTRSLFETDDMLEQHQLLNKVAKMVDNKEIRTTIASRFGSISAQNLLKAHALVESNQAKGKIVLSGFDL